MNDRIVLGFFLYLLIASFTIGLLPDEFFSGSTPSDLDEDELKGALEESPTGVFDSIPYFIKVTQFMFVPISITGVPTILGLIIQLFHLIIFFTTGVYVAKLIRGVT